MPNFNAAQALAVCTATLKRRQESRKASASYVLFYYKNAQEAQQNRPSGKITGATIATGINCLYQQFAEKYSYYPLAFIINESDPTKVLRYYNSATRSKHGKSATKISNGWHSMTKKNKKQ